MTTDLKSLNAGLFSNELFEEWINRKNLIPAEEYFLKKYLTDKTKNVLEAGTGGGRISFHIEKMGFSNISAFDIVPEMIKHARSLAKSIGSNIEFEVADAASLKNYENDAFDYLVYLQQVLCFISKKELFSDSLKEAYRVAKKDGIVVFSFLDFDSKSYNSTLSLVINIIRKTRGEEVLKQHLPWLKINNKYNWKLFNRNQPVTYWVKKNLIINELKDIGFSILEAKNANQLNNDTISGKGMLYIVCRK
jgi:ubiquinone/menaquinone biosynthesis C-methylase UbiE